MLSLKKYFFLKPARTRAFFKKPVRAQPLPITPRRYQTLFFECKRKKQCGQAKSRQPQKLSSLLVRRPEADEESA